MTVKPLADRVLIEPNPAEEKQQADSTFLIPQKRNLWQVK